MAESAGVDRSAQPGMVQRSLLGGILGGIGGALAGIVLGGLAGGPIGALIGGVTGLLTGAAIGNDATTRSRGLTSTEIGYARDIFRDTLDYSDIRITRDSMYSIGAPLTIGNTVHLKTPWDERGGMPIDLFQGDTLDLTKDGHELLIHEMAHVWQYQNGGLAYIPKSLLAQLGAWVSGGKRDGAYGWREQHKANTPWAEWNPEQQASAVEDYNILLRKSKDGTATVADIADLATLTGYMSFVWRREGAPTFNTGDMSDAPI
jgi:hypothetical protein